jgi:CopG family transcriptional regulator/antitoxin EndoAI
MHHDLTQKRHSTTLDDARARLRQSFFWWGRGAPMVQHTKRIVICLPDTLLEEVDDFVEQEQSSRSEFIRQAMRVYMNEQRKLLLRRQMQHGYAEMAPINLLMSIEAFSAETEAEHTCERLVSGV